MSALPEWLGNLRDRLAREVSGFSAEFDAALKPGADLDATRTPILARILEEIALPSVTVDFWSVRPAVQGVIAALRSGDPKGLRAARHAAEDAAEDAAADGVSAAGAAAWAAEDAAVASSTSAVVAAAAYSVAAAGATAWRRIADIVLAELARLAPAGTEEVTS